MTKHQFNQATVYMTDVIMPSNRKNGCKCNYTPASYEKGEFHHKSGCPSPKIENLPNPKLFEALRRA